MNQLMKAYLSDHVTDELGEIEELENWHVFAGDGHYHKAAVFDPKTKADLSRKESNKSVTGHFFRLDMRTHHLGYLDLAQPKDGKKSEHDMKMLRRRDLGSLRPEFGKGKKSSTSGIAPASTMPFGARQRLRKASISAYLKRVTVSPNSYANTMSSTTATVATKALSQTGSSKPPKATKFARSFTSIPLTAWNTAT